MDVGCDLAHVGGGEAALELEIARIDGHVVDRAVQHLGRGVAVDIQRLRKEHRAPFLHLLGALVALAGHDHDGIGNNQHRPHDALGAAPLARHLLAHALGALLALRHERPYEQQRDEESQHEAADEEELEAGTIEEAPDGRHHAFHDARPLFATCSAPI